MELKQKCLKTRTEISLIKTELNKTKMNKKRNLTKTKIFEM